MVIDFHERMIPAEDGYPLSARIYGESKGSVILIASATAVPQRYYQPFAEWLSQQGHSVVTFDYRGIGGSLPEEVSLKNFSARMQDWALLDTTGALNWIARAYPGARISLIGHSFGGQGLGLLPNHALVRRAVLVTTQNGYWRLFNKTDQPKFALLWYVFAPLMCHLFGYFPSRAFGLGENLPKGVMLQWAHWCKQKDYLMGDIGKAFPGYFDKVTCPILAIKVTDDAYAPNASVESLLRHFTQAPVKLRALDPAEFGLKHIGHFGVFREQFKNSVWKEIADWLNEATTFE